MNNDQFKAFYSLNNLNLLHSLLHFQALFSRASSVGSPIIPTPELVKSINQ